MQGSLLSHAGGISSSFSCTTANNKQLNLLGRKLQSPINTNVPNKAKYQLAWLTATSLCHSNNRQADAEGWGPSEGREGFKGWKYIPFYGNVTLFLVWVRFSWCCSSRSFSFFWRLNFVSGCSQIFHNETAWSVAQRWKICGEIWRIYNISYRTLTIQRFLWYPK